MAVLKVLANILGAVDRSHLAMLMLLDLSVGRDSFYLFILFKR